MSPTRRLGLRFGPGNPFTALSLHLITTIASLEVNTRLLTNLHDITWLDSPRLLCITYFRLRSKIVTWSSSRAVTWPHRKFSKKVSIFLAQTKVRVKPYLKVSFYLPLHYRLPQTQMTFTKSLSVSSLLSLSPSLFAHPVLLSLDQGIRNTAAVSHFVFLDDFSSNLRVPLSFTTVFS